MRRLIVNADDFGLTGGVNRAIAELRSAGVLTSTTLMARAPATDEAIALARANPSLGVGCHVVLADGEPVLPAREIPTLVDARTGRFAPSLGVFLARLLTGRIRTCEIEAEAIAQIASLQARGAHLTHIDTHKHTHMFPAVLRPLLRAAGSAGIRAVRNPFEAAWSLHATPGAPGIRRAQVWTLKRLEPAFRRAVAEEGFSTTDGALGVLATGTLDAATVRALLSRMPDGDWELVAHPGYLDSDLQQAHTRLLASREQERLALLEVAKADGLELVSFAGLLPPRRLHN